MRVFQIGLKFTIHTQVLQVLHGQNIISALNADSNLLKIIQAYNGEMHEAL